MSARHPSGYICSISRQLLAGKPDWLRSLMGTRAYDWAFMAVICRVLGRAAERGFPGSKIDFVFDECSELRKCIESFESHVHGFPKNMKELAGVAIPGDDKDLASLQCADLLASLHSSYQETRQKNEIYEQWESLGVSMDVFPAHPPESEIRSMLHYAKETDKRQRVAHQRLKILKDQGVKLDDFKE